MTDTTHVCRHPLSCHLCPHRVECFGAEDAPRQDNFYPPVLCPERVSKNLEKVWRQNTQPYELVAGETHCDRESCPGLFIGVDYGSEHAEGTAEVSITIDPKPSFENLARLLGVESENNEPASNNLKERIKT